jgi:hypothetical protein
MLADAKPIFETFLSSCLLIWKIKLFNKFISSYGNIL